MGRGEAGQERTLFGHPRGVFVLAGTEVWDRISLQGMQALLVLYMVKALLLPGHIEHVLGFAGYRGFVEHFTGPLSIDALATQTFGFYVSLVYVMPLVGGVIGDRLLGRRNTVIIGGLMMSAGHLLLTFDASFLIAIALLILGAGLFRGNLTPQMGELYDVKDRRRDEAFQIYAMALNIGAFLGPLITASLATYVGWHVGFGFAGVGMLIGLAVYIGGSGSLPKREALKLVEDPAAPKLGRDDWRALVFLFALAPVSTLFWIAQSQIWNTYNLWVKDHVDMHIFGWEMPIPFLQSIDAAPVVLIPLVLAFWRWQASRGREPGDFVKAALGCVIFGAATWWLGFAYVAADAHGRAPIWWLAVFHLVSNLGWVYFAPTVIAIYSRLAPPSLNATMYGVYTLSVAFGAFISGRLGSLYENVSSYEFWTIHAAIVIAGGAIILFFGLVARRMPRARPVPRSS
ncbi:MAG TPA: peptide MFS transporter [Rhizomicrobium sp.]|nr:peptide MFS transporter [Rhizomicrobium sp.]